MDKFELFSKIISYPDIFYKQNVEQGLIELKDSYPDAYQYLETFDKKIAEMDLTALEEKYTKTYDIQGQCCLDVGYILFGEDYKRGQFLVEINRLANEHQVDTESELPDHLPNILKLLVKLDKAERKEMIERILLPALDKMMENFGHTSNPFSLPLKTIETYLQTDFNMDKKLFGGPIC